MPVDLIVPMHVAAGPGRRSARLGGDHGKNSARKSEGALLVAKRHKLGDRMDKPERLDAKDAGDVYRQFDIVAPDEMATRLMALLTDERSAEATVKALDYGDTLLAWRAAP